LIDQLQNRGARAALDASGEALRLGLDARPFLVKPNAVEAGEISGVTVTDDDSARRAAGYCLERGAQIAALSLGADGLLLAGAAVGMQAGFVRVRAPQIKCKNTVGAGDALLAGIVWALERGLPLEEAARWGVACGSAAAALDGTNFAPLEAVEQLYRTLLQAG
jgi:tagatose 6-phosphate kinase